MLVGERMSTPVITIKPEVPIQEALNLMHKEHVRRFPVVDHHGHLVGLVSEKDLLNASPSEATSLSVWELNYLLSKITVERVMTRKIISVSKDTPLEEAARIMADNNISSLPVIQDEDVVGMITETDLFRIFLELLGAREGGVRVTALISNTPGKIHELSGIIYASGGNIISFGTFLGDSSENGIVTFKVGNIPLKKLEEIISPCIEKIVDIRETKAA
jgi:acetoin utilization protein AcuB